METLHRMSANPALRGLLVHLEAGCPYSFSSWTLGNPGDHCLHEYLNNWGPSWRQVTCLCGTFALSLQRRGGLDREGLSEDKMACLPISSSFTSTSEHDNFSESLTLGDHACLSLIQDADAFLSMRIKSEKENEWLIVSDWPFSIEPAWPKCCAPLNSQCATFSWPAKRIWGDQKSSTGTCSQMPTADFFLIVWLFVLKTTECFPLAL